MMKRTPILLIFSKQRIEKPPRQTKTRDSLQDCLFKVKRILLINNEDEL